jgi:hypothetical protein
MSGKVLSEREDRRSLWVTGLREEVEEIYAFYGKAVPEGAKVSIVLWEDGEYEIAVPASLNPFRGAAA